MNCTLLKVSIWFFFNEMENSAIFFRPTPHPEFGISRERQLNGVRMWECYFWIPKMFKMTFKVQKQGNCSEVFGLPPFPETGAHQTWAATVFLWGRECSSLLFVVFFCLLHICYWKQYKRCYGLVSWISLYVWKRESPWLFFLKSGHLSEKWLFRVAMFVALSVLSFFFFQWLELSFLDHTTRFRSLTRFFWLVVTVAKNLRPTRLKPSLNLKNDTWSYLNLLQNLYVLSRSSLASYIVHNKYIIIC